MGVLGDSHPSGCRSWAISRQEEPRMNRGIKFGKVAMVAAFATVAFAIPASAATNFVQEPANSSVNSSGCVTRSEYRRVHKGNSMSRVHRIFGTRGKQSWEYDGYYIHSQGREYRVCGSSWGFVSVTYDREYGTWRLDSKYAYWG
jgi:hypothetical protein